MTLVALMVPRLSKGHRMSGKQGQRVSKLYVGGRSREILEELTKAFLLQGGIEKLTSVEREMYERNIVERGLSIGTAITELALTSFAARVTGRWIADDTTEPSPASEEAPGER